MNELERMVADGAARLFKEQCGAAEMHGLDQGKLPEKLWASFAESGFEMLLGEAEGNAGEAMAAALQLVMLSGYHRVPLPIREVMVARALLGRAGIAQPEGIVVACRIEAAPAGAGTKARLTGNATAVPWARHAASIVVVAGAPGEERVCLVNAKDAGAGITANANIAAEPRDGVKLEGVGCDACVPLADSGLLLDLYNAQMAAAALTGAAEAALDLAVQYAKDRVQFGQPIGRFQAVQQALAIAAGEVSSARAACALAFRTASPQLRAAAVAKVRAGSAASLVANAAHQVHGAIGITQEYQLHFLTRRLWSWRAENGTEAFWAGRLGKLVIERGAAHLWADITAAGLARDF
ncbi:MAG: h16 [Ramlibacter sp.]|nr:h16 [Ramlibacter sp.]